MKNCNKCTKDKDEIQFYPSEFKRKYSWCIVCFAEYRKNNKTKITLYSKNYREKNKKKIKDYSNQYLATNKKKKAEYSKMYYVQNRDKFLEYRREYYRNRRKNNPSVRLRESISGMVYWSLKKNGSSKNKVSCVKYLSFSMTELKSHLEKQFEPWMTWSNWGKYNKNIWDDNDLTTWTWQIDHVVPQSKLSYSSMEDDNFKKCWSLENLRPLSAKQNIIDGNRRHIIRMIND